MLTKFPIQPFDSYIYEWYTQMKNHPSQISLQYSSLKSAIVLSIEIAVVSKNDEVIEKLYEALALLISGDIGKPSSGDDCKVACHCSRCSDGDDQTACLQGHRVQR